MVCGLGALLRDGVEIVGEAALRHRLAVDDGDDAVDRQMRADRRPFEGLDQRLGQSEAATSR